MPLLPKQHVDVGLRRRQKNGKSQPGNMRNVPAEGICQSERDVAPIQVERWEPLATCIARIDVVGGPAVEGLVNIEHDALDAHPPWLAEIVHDGAYLPTAGAGEATCQQGGSGLHSANAPSDRGVEDRINVVAGDIDRVQFVFRPIRGGRRCCRNYPAPRSAVFAPLC